MEGFQRSDDQDNFKMSMMDIVLSNIEQVDADLSLGLDHTSRQSPPLKQTLSV